MEIEEITEKIKNVLNQAFDKVEVEHEDSGFTYIKAYKGNKSSTRTFTTSTMKEILSTGNAVHYLDEIKFDLLMFM